MNSTDINLRRYDASELVGRCREALLDGGFNLVRKVFQGVDRQETADHMFGLPEANQELVVVFDGSEKIIGFAGIRQLSLKESKVTYRVGTIVDPEHQGRGIYKRLIREGLHPDSEAMVVRTQNPRVYQSIRSAGIFEEIYPRIDGEEVPRKIYETASEVLELIGKKPNIDPQSLIVRGVYGEGLYSEPISCRKDDVNALFRKLGRGDGFVIVGMRS